MKTESITLQNVHGVEEISSFPTRCESIAAAQESPCRLASITEVSNQFQSSSLSTLRQTWQSERQAVSACIDELRQWMNEVSQLGIPHFGETATRLRPLREQLVDHFACEDEMIAKVARSPDTGPPSTKGLASESSREHRELLSQLDEIVRDLDQLEPPFPSWQAAIRAVEHFIDSLEQHESREIQRVNSLPPQGSESPDRS